jgi:hypothetical protein
MQGSSYNTTLTVLTDYSLYSENPTAQVDSLAGPRSRYFFFTFYFNFLFHLYGTMLLAVDLGKEQAGEVGRRKTQTGEE